MSAATRRKSSALYSASPPFAELRIAACMSWHAALWRLIARFLWALHSLAMCVHESGLWHKGHSSVGAFPYLLASLPLYSCPWMDLRSCVPSFEFSRRLTWSAVPVVAVVAPCFFACIMSLLQMEVWCRLWRVAALTFCLNCCEGRVKACIWKRSSSGIDHNGGRRVACLGHMARADLGLGGRPCT